MLPEPVVVVAETGMDDSESAAACSDELLDFLVLELRLLLEEVEVEVSGFARAGRGVEEEAGKSARERPAADAALEEAGGDCMPVVLCVLDPAAAVLPLPLPLRFASALAMA